MSPTIQLPPTELTLLRDHQYQVREGVTVWISQRAHKKGFAPNEAQAVFERKTSNHDHQVVLGLMELQQIARFCGHAQPYEMLGSGGHDLEPENGKGYDQDESFKEYKLRDSGWKTNLWVYDNTKLELEHKYGKNEPWNRVTLQIADVLAVLGLINLQDEYLPVPPPSQEEVHDLRWGFQRQLRVPVSPQPDEETNLEIGEFHLALIDAQGDLQEGPLVFGAISGDAELCVVCPYGQPGSMRWGRLIDSVRVERVQSITEVDAQKQGLQRVQCPTHGAAPARKWKNYLGQAYYCGANLNTAQESFKTRFISEYGREAWESNVWVWVINF